MQLELQALQHTTLLTGDQDTHTQSMMLSALFGRVISSYYANSGSATKTKPIGDYEDPQFTTIVNSALTAAPIGLLPKMSEFCHTSNRLLVGHQRRRALWRLYFYSSTVGRWMFAGWSVHNKGSQALGVSLQKDKKT